jgi:hypothetical protein
MHMVSKAASVRVGAAVALAIVGVGAEAQLGFVPPAGFSGKPGPGVATPAEPGAPALTRIADADLSDLFRVDPAYPRRASAKVVGAFAVVEPAGTHLVGAWAPGFLPITLAFSDGRCFALSADYTGGTLSNGRLNRVSCEIGRSSYQAPFAPLPAGWSLRLVGSAWSYGAWADDQAGTTIITAPDAKAFQPLFTARLAVSAIMAMNGPDWPGGNMTLVGRIGGHLTVVTLEVGY